MTSVSMIGLTIALEALELGRKVIVPAFAPPMAAHAVRLTGRVPVACDVDPTTRQLSAGVVEPLIDDETAAILAVNLWGDACDVAGLEALAARRGLALIFDSSQAFGCRVGERAVGGLLQIAPEMHGMPPHWQPYFMVDDVDATFRKAQSLGTKEHFGPMDIEHVGRFAVLHDPQGAAFAIIKLAQRG